MKIAIMMRAMDQDSGFRMYVENLVEALLKLGAPDISYLLFYRSEKHFGRFSAYPNAREFLLGAPHKLLWDQVAVPYSAWKHRADVIFNPKFTAPLITHCPVVMGLQEPAWFVVPEFYEKFDVLYQKWMLPIYVHKAAHLFAMAHWVVEENKKYLKLPFDNCTVTYPGVHEKHKPVTDRAVLEAFRHKYALPDRFVLSMTRVDNPGMDKSKKWNPSQNPDTILKSFLLYKDRVPHHLVMAGRRVKDYFLDNGYSEKDFEKVHFINFVPFEEIQNLYSLADLIVLPVFYESFSFTLLGAMACGCPSVVSSTGAFKEIVGDGALYADPHSPKDFADRVLSILQDDNLRMTLIKKSRAKSEEYTWEQTARLTLDGIYRALGKSGCLQ